MTVLVSVTSAPTARTAPPAPVLTLPRKTPSRTVSELPVRARIAPPEADRPL